MYEYAARYAVTRHYLGLVDVDEQSIRSKTTGSKLSPQNIANKEYKQASVQDYLARGRIAFVSPLAAANAFVHSPMAAGEQCAMHSCASSLL